jgi:outer membrane protein TolC
MLNRKIMMGALLIVGMLLCGAALPFQAAAETPSGVLTFDQFYQKAFAYYPKLKAVHSDVEIALAEQMKASAGFWPSLSLSAGMSETDDPVNVFGMLMRQDRFTQGDFELNRLNTPRHQRDLQGGVHIRWPLFDAMQTVHRVRASREKIKASEQDEAFTKMEVFLLAHDAFTSAIAMERMWTAAEASEEKAQEDLKKAEDLKDKGMILGADFYGAKVRAGRFLQMKNEWSRQMKGMRMLLNIMMGEPLTNEIRLPVLLPEVNFLEASLDELVKEALMDRPDLKAAALRVQAMQEELKRVQDDALPTIEVTADGTNNRHDLGDHGGNNAAAGIRAELPLFDPSRKGRVAGAKASLMRAEQEEGILKDNVLKDIAAELARFEALRANYPVLSAMSEDAARAVEMLLPLYNEGRKSIIDLEDAREAHFAALSAFEQMKAALFSSEARLFFLGGKMDAEGMKALSVKVGGL